MDDMMAMVEKFPDDMPIILEKDGMEYTVSKKECLQMLKARKAV